MSDNPVRVGMPLRAPKTAELIATSLRRQIVRRDLRPGEKLPPETQLMEQFGVSRPTLREAFRILEVESLIGVRRGAHGGAYVLEPDPVVAARHVGVLLQIQGTTVQDVHEARTLTEPLCAGLLARVRTPADLEDLRAVVQSLRSIADAGMDAVPDISSWSRTTYRFHELILQRCGNKTLAVQGAVLADLVDTHLQQALARGIGEPVNFSERYQTTLRSYSKLVRLVEAGDSPGAEKHWRRHMEVSGEYLTGSRTTSTLVDVFG